MQSFTTLIATFAAISAVSASPIIARDTCGSAPSGSGSQTPIQQPSNIQTAQACQDACNSNGQCQSFVFGMVDNAIKCMLFSVPAAQVPKQDTNLVVFDKACTSVPAVTPTSSNPTGAATSGSGSNSNQNGQQSGTNNQNGQQGGNNQQQGGQKLAVRDTCGATPAGTNANQQPLSQPTGINSAADCLAKCKADASCKSFEFGAENGANVCKLFSVPAAQVPPPSNGQTFQVYDVGCSV